ncbi:MAG: TolC family protein [Candidatus Adiutrix sp.]|jgi:outer membrane protein TolC|nr:TolC family protein [Candidatus Adiutrix sp.]
MKKQPPALRLRLGRPAALAALVAALAAAGCARVTPPGPSLADRLAYGPAVEARYRPDQRWWRVYGDERLNALVELALQNNLDLARAALSVNRALFQAGLVEADLTPSFSGGLSASSRRNLRQGGPSVRAFGGQAQLGYELDLWRKVADAASAAQWEYQATAEDLEATRLTLINKVADAYYNLAYLNDALAAGEANLKNLQTLVETTRAKHQAGKVAAVEPAQAAQAVLSAESGLLGYQNQLQTAGQTMRNFLNLQPNDPLNLEGLTLSRVEPPEPDLRVPLAVLANRPDLKAAEFRLRRAFENVKVAEKAWLPAISLEAAISSSGAALAQAFNQPLGTAGLTLSLPFLDWARVADNLRLTEVDFETVRLNFETALTTALNEVDTFHQHYRTARAALDNARRRYAQDFKIGDYYRDRYQSGAAELSDWLNAANSVNTSRLAALNALYELITAANRTYQAMGGRYVDTAIPGLPPNPLP